jgi:molybdopterin-containing oxidoreductase family iron-sulfur binding subunit
MSDHEHDKQLRILQGPPSSLGPKPSLDQGHRHDQENEEVVDNTLREHRLELSTVREKLKDKSGKQYWRTLEELSEDPHFEELLHREFPRHASEWDDAVDRRDFLKLMGASLALAGLAGCGRPDESHIVPYVKQPDGMVLGRPNYYATVMPFGADAVGVLVESHEGRPTKIEGNPDHPSSMGATSAIVQASILNLYDPDRAQTVLEGGEIRAWSTFLGSAQDWATGVKATGGAGFRILTGTVTSPTLASQLRKLLALYPQAKWHQWEPAVSDGVREGAKLAFGRAVNTVYVPGKADVILSLDADFLASGPGHISYAKQWGRRRKLEGANDSMNRLYVVEPTPTVTGSAADNKLPMRACDIELFARALAAKLGRGNAVGLPSEAEKWLNTVVADLQKARSNSLVIAGEQQSANVHALAHAINAALGNAGTTVYYTEPVEAEPVNQLESLRELCVDMNAGKVDLLVILGGNPVYDAPHDFDFVTKLKKVHTSVHLSPYFDETSAYCQWHVSESHYLESWSDARAYDGTASIVQPLISPLYYTKSAHDVVAAFGDKPGQPPYDAVRAYWTEASIHLETAIDAGWRKWLNDGVIAGTKLPPINPELKFNPASLSAFVGMPADQVEYIFRPDPTVYDGRFANNGWLQELPKPVTKLTWDNAALVSPKFAQKNDLAHKVVSRGGEHGQVRSTVVDIELNGSKVTAATWTLPGQAENTVVLPLGYGRTRAGFAGTNKGFNAYVVRTSNAMWSAAGGKMTATGEGYSLACTQYHFNMEGRQILSTATLDEYKKNPAFPHEGHESPAKDDSLYKEFAYPGYAWGMAIDLNKCNGCNACVVACQSENNIPVVGKDQVMRGREMHWIRIDRYYTHTPGAMEGHTGDPTEYSPALDNPQTFFQPVPCMQCENAPCEQVCPVGATAHSAEGLNDMVYNRCVGTRYCSNNCPYKVRRFNFLRFQDWETPQLKLLRNPEVTVRSRGVMEKCTYCVQRINNARIDAEKQNRPIRDGEIVTACESACPSEAIAFGNINDPNSKVAKLKAQQRNYTLLGELNARPRTTYLGAVRNPNAELEKG